MKKILKTSVFVVILAFMLFSGQNIFAQGTLGSIRGTVTDVNQAVVANSTV
jgi:hypothetical protein